MTELLQSATWLGAADIVNSGLLANVWQWISGLPTDIGQAFTNFFQSVTWLEAYKILHGELVSDIWQTIYSTVLSTLFAYVIGLPLGVLLVAGEEGGVMPMPKSFMSVLNFIINILRSVPFLILMIIALPLSRAIVGSGIGTPAMIPPLTIAAFPFIARLVESSLRETDRGVIEAAQSMGATPMQIIRNVMLPEAKPSLLIGAALAFATIMGYGAMAGIIGGRGLGFLAINYGLYRKVPIVMWVAVILLVVLVQIFQSAGTKLAVKSDKRITNNMKRRRKQ